MFKAISFYKYIKIENIEEIEIEIKEICNSINIQGRILIGDEGKLPDNFKFIKKYNVLRLYKNEDTRTERN